MNFFRIFGLSVFLLLASCSGVRAPFSSSAMPAQGEVSQVALLLPLKGSVSKQGGTVREGFLASYYQVPGDMSIDVVNAPANTNAMPYYDEAKNKGANFVVGPLEKDQLRSLTKHGSLPVPTLALNYTDGNIPDNMIQFGLSPLDEVDQITQRAAREGHHKALIIVSADSWGRKISNSLASSWRERGGEVIAVMPIGRQNIVDQLKKIMPPPEENNRVVPFDVVLLAALPNQARSAVSMLRFYGLGDKPVYATASVYSGAPSLADKDLDGVRFCDIPWIVDPTPDMNTAAQQLRAIHKDTDVRLYALGVDAYRLIGVLPSLASGSEFHGLTGTLTLQGQRIKRQLAWGQFVNGKVVPLS